LRGQIGEGGRRRQSKIDFFFNRLLLLRFMPIGSLVMTAGCCLAAYATENRRDNPPGLT
jgi:hypothetical protein